MPTINDGELLLDADVSSLAELQSGFEAGRAVLKACGLPLWDIFVAVFNEEGVSLGGRRRLAKRDRLGAAVMGEAQYAAAMAMGSARPRASFALAEVFFESERRIDAAGIRHLNPPRGPHYRVDPTAA